MDWEWDGVVVGQAPEGSSGRDGLRPIISPRDLLRPILYSRSFIRLPRVLLLPFLVLLPHSATYVCTVVPSSNSANSFCPTIFPSAINLTPSAAIPFSLLHLSFNSFSFASALMSQSLDLPSPTIQTCFPPNLPRLANSLLVALLPFVHERSHVPWHLPGLVPGSTKCIQVPRVLCTNTYHTMRLRGFCLNSTFHHPKTLLLITSLNWRASIDTPRSPPSHSPTRSSPFDDRCQASPSRPPPLSTHSHCVSWPSPSLSGSTSTSLSPFFHHRSPRSLQSALICVPAAPVHPIV